MLSSRLILSGNAFDNFVNSIKSDQTRDHYIFSLKKYMEYQKVADVNNLLLSNIDTRLVSARIIDFIVYLRQKKQLSASTINVYIVIFLPLKS